MALYCVCVDQGLESFDSSGVPSIFPPMSPQCRPLMTFSCIKKMPLPATCGAVFPHFVSFLPCFSPNSMRPGTGTHWKLASQDSHIWCPNRPLVNPFMPMDKLPTYQSLRISCPATRFQPPCCGVTQTQHWTPRCLSLLAWNGPRRDGSSCSIKNASFVGFVALVIEKPCSEIGGSYPRTLG